MARNLLIAVVFGLIGFALFYPHNPSLTLSLFGGYYAVLAIKGVWYFYGTEKVDA